MAAVVAVAHPAVNSCSNSPSQIQPAIITARERYLSVATQPNPTQCRRGVRPVSACVGWRRLLAATHPPTAQRGSTIRRVLVAAPTNRVHTAFKQRERPRSRVEWHTSPAQSRGLARLPDHLTTESCIHTHRITSHHGQPMAGTSHDAGHTHIRTHTHTYGHAGGREWSAMDARCCERARSAL
jgi:hypothetical protein